VGVGLQHGWPHGAATWLERRGTLACDVEVTMSDLGPPSCRLFARRGGADSTQGDSRRGRCVRSASATAAGRKRPPPAVSVRGAGTDAAAGRQRRHEREAAGSRMNGATLRSAPPDLEQGSTSSKTRFAAATRASRCSATRSSWRSRRLPSRGRVPERDVERVRAHAGALRDRRTGAVQPTGRIGRPGRPENIPIYTGTMPAWGSYDSGGIDLPGTATSSRTEGIQVRGESRARVHLDGNMLDVTGDASRGASHSARAASDDSNGVRCSTVAAWGPAAACLCRPRDCKPAPGPVRRLFRGRVESR